MLDFSDLRLPASDFPISWSLKTKQQVRAFLLDSLADSSALSFRSVKLNHESHPSDAFIISDLWPLISDF